MVHSGLHDVGDGEADGPGALAMVGRRLELEVFKRALSEVGTPVW
jgi:hypothetical protein